MKEMTLKIISNNLLAKLAFNLIGNDIQNHLDAYTDVDFCKNVATESIAISRIIFFDTPIYLIGGYEGDVKMVDVSGCNFDTQEEIIDKIHSSLYSFTENEDYVAIDIEDLNNTKIDYSKLSSNELLALNNAKIMIMAE